ncbi:hypothetical protein HYN43_024895 [Mucilaginibacter celer]|uniref:Uncharacterized protein n=1 Tax=Mucilaginibacter celer TaxID=2305508 RepID=A0A494VTQ2_9SPHI|nr:hypothetical protein HYN43_024895 [Mucilaginibacter celer]
MTVDRDDYFDCADFPDPFDFDLDYNQLKNFDAGSFLQRLSPVFTNFTQISSNLRPKTHVKTMLILTQKRQFINPLTIS